MKKHILCLGDSNTHGYCADPADCADHGIRFNEDERWTCRLQTALGSDYLVTEEGLSGRTTVFVDPIHESMDALSVAYSLLKSHEVIDLLIIMLGTNDVKERFFVFVACIGAGPERLIFKAKSGPTPMPPASSRVWIGLSSWPRAWTAGGPRLPTSSSWPRPASAMVSMMPSWARAVWKSRRAWPSSSVSSRNVRTSISSMLPTASSIRWTSCI